MNVEANEQPKIFKIIGLDLVGAQIVREVAKQKPAKVSFLEIHSEAPFVTSSSLPSLHWYKVEKESGAEEMANMEGSASDEQIVALLHAITGVRFLIVAAGIGKNSSTGLLKEIAQLATEIGIPVLIFAVYPFARGDHRSQQKVNTAVQEMVDAGFSVVLINGTIPNVALKEDVKFFQRSLKALITEVASAVIGLSEYITHPGLINLNLADVEAVLCHGKRIRFGSATENGRDRATRAVYKALLDLEMIGFEFKSVKSVLVFMATNRNLTMREMKSAYQIISDVFGEKTEIVWGTVLKEEITDEDFNVKIYAVEG